MSEANDANQIADQICGAEADLGQKCEVACADSGYSDIVEIEKLESAGKTVLVPAQALGKEVGPFDKSKFAYDSGSNCYLCPEGHRLIFRRFQDREKQKKDYRIENPKECRECRHFGKCTESNQGRTITRHVLEELREAISKRFEDTEIKKVYGRRKSRVEHPFGYIKKVLGFGQFLLRGLDGVRAEASLIGTCFNLRRMINLLGGVEGFIARVQAVQAQDI